MSNEQTDEQRRLEAIRWQLREGIAPWGSDVPFLLAALDARDARIKELEAHLRNIRMNTVSQATALACDLALAASTPR